MPPHLKTLLFIISNDFGELAASAYATSGQPYNLVMALPPRLYPLHHRGLGTQCMQYASVDELLALADLYHPQMVFLFSGYLFGINGIFGPADLQRLVNGLSYRECRLATSDPFLGLARDPDPSLFAGPDERGSGWPATLSRSPQRSVTWCICIRLRCLPPTSIPFDPSSIAMSCSPRNETPSS